MRWYFAIPHELHDGEAQVHAAHPGMRGTPMNDLQVVLLLLDVLGDIQLAVTILIVPVHHDVRFFVCRLHCVPTLNGIEVLPSNDVQVQPTVRQFLRVPLASDDARMSRAGGNSPFS